MGSRKLLSVIVPVYNEETNVRPFYQVLAPVLTTLDVDSEIIFIDDGSSDKTFEIVSELAKADRRIKCIRFSRNFGSHSGYMAGMRYASGDATVIISADLQDPPDLIPEFVRKWQEGHHVVWAVREGRADPFFKKLFAVSFYTLFRRIALPRYPAAGMDFGLFDRRVTDNLKNMNEVNHFFTGQVVWLGFRVAMIPYQRRARLSGESKWPLGKRIKNAMDAIISFSYFPVRFISYTGLVVSFLSFIYAVVLIVRKLFFDLGTPGWPAVMVAVLFLGGLQLTMLGILGEYIWRGTEQTKGRPQYVVMETLGLSEGNREQGTGNSRL